MATAVETRTRSRPRTRPFELAAAATSLWIVGGAFLDGWSHRAFPSEESFFTPWHAVLYSGLLASAAVHAVRAGRSGLPAGYGPSVWGLGLFFAAGAADGVWHTLLGVEESFGALVSPPHLVLFGALGLIVTGPLRASEPGGRATLPVLGSGAALLGLLTFVSQFDHPLLDAPGAGAGPVGVSHELVELGQEHGVLGVLLQVAVTVGVLAWLSRRVRLTAGSVAGLLGVQGGLLWVLERDPLILVAGALIAGVGAAAFRWTGERPDAFGAVLGLGVAGAYFLTAGVAEGLWWPTHVWTGAIVLAGASGWLLGRLATPEVRGEGSVGGSVSSGGA